MVMQINHFYVLPAWTTDEKQIEYYFRPTFHFVDHKKNEINVW